MSPKNKNKKNTAKSPYKLAETVSIVSHQLKTPLSVIKGYLEVLISEDLGKLNKEQKEYLKNTLENAERMKTLVKDILNVTRIEANKVELNPEPIDLVKLTEGVVKNYSLFARAHNSKISFDPPKKLPLIEVDSIKIREVIGNFVSNAIFYNKKNGKIKLTLSEKGKNIVFCCKDSGIGISEKAKNKIFQKFYRSEEAIAVTPKGSGLGLFISKAIIKKSGGKIWFKSKRGEGSTFCFSLPKKS